MASFFDKLKRGMGVEIEPNKEETEKELIESETVAERLKPVKKRKKPKKLDIKTEAIETDGQEAEKDEPIQEKPKEEKGLEFSRQSFAENLGGQEGQLTVDVYETDGELVIQSTIAGVKPDELDISIENDRVLVRGKRAEQVKEEGKNYFYQECYWGAFSREIILPVETDPNRVEATMKNGILTIRLPKIERQKKRKITVEG